MIVDVAARRVVALTQPGSGPDGRAVERAGGVKFQCPGCVKEGHDKHRDNAVLFPTGHFGCAVNADHWPVLAALFNGRPVVGTQRGGTTETPASPEARHCTDAGNAVLFVQQHQERVRSCYALRRYYVWDQRRWEPDAEGQVLELAKQTAASLYDELAHSTAPGRRKELAPWAVKSESEPRLRAMLALAASAPELAVTPDELDADPWKLNVLNGVVDLRTGTLAPHDPGRLMTKLAPVVYNPQADCPRFLAFMDRIFAGRGPLIEFMQRALGYALSGDVSEQVLFLLHGVGANGKSTLVRVVRGILGDYGCSTPPETLLVKREAGIPNDVARLHGARFVSAVEVEGGRRLAESLVKTMTGGDTLVARFLHREFFEFRPTFTLFLAVNRKPRIAGTDHAIWRRLRLVPFDVVIPDTEQDRHLAERLIAEEGPGILTWMVRGCMAWQKNGLGTPEEVRSATATYRVEQDALGAFLRERCILEPAASVTVTALYDAYTSWASTSGERRPWSKRELHARLTERGVKDGRRGDARLWRGVRLRTATDQDSADAPEAAREGVAPW